MIEEINHALQIGSITLLSLTCALLVRNWQSGKHIWVAVGFSISIIAYLVVEDEFVRKSILIQGIVLVWTISVAVLFWLLALSIFDDHFRPQSKGEFKPFAE